MVNQNAGLPDHFSLDKVIRPNILSLKPYRCARDDYERGILLDANENSLGSALSPTEEFEQQGKLITLFSLILLAPPAQQLSPEHGGLNIHSLSLHRYPSPSQIPIKQNLCDYRNSIQPDLPPLEPANVFLGVGSDEILDLLFRIACKPGDSEGIGDQVIVTPPTYGMYSVCAKVNDVGMINVPLNVEGGAFTVDLEHLDSQLSQGSSSRPIKLVILCSPGNPTGTTIPLGTIEKILSNPKFNGILVVDEAYIDFAGNEKSAIKLVRQGWRNLIVTHTLSKGFGLAGIRLGIAYGSADLIQVLNNTKAPYTISSPTSSLGYEATKPDRLKATEAHISKINENRDWLQRELVKITGLGKILGQTEANFILIQVMNFDSPTDVDSQRAKSVYKYMAEDSELGQTPIVVRYRGDELGCQGCLRITVGSRLECQKLVAKLAQTLQLIH
ncbi:histidinol-phosphate transaminase [Puccinia graminis f. sp. tritici]|uniref:histidinol-phosphate transaminase n=1 Tax=Puccinia graminis f. sp. tritici TaxID=56615 RepID=A0A5B0R5J0_PUCGR|nr:histidinol-phosphate transaminase [Puccinia graminis f. sp. tritici]